MSHKNYSLPKRRFPEFRNAGAWEEKRLGDIAKIVTGKTPKTSDATLWNGDIYFITPTDISDYKYQATVARTVVATKGLKILPIGSILYTCIASIGKIALTVKPSITNQQINSILPNEHFNNEYLYYFLLYLTPKIKGCLANSTLPIINKTEFSSFIIQVPNKEEEQKIADCLSSIDDLISAQTQKLDTLKDHKKGLMQQLFPTEGKTIPKRRFSEFRNAGAWEEKRLGEACLIRTGKKNANEGTSDGIYPFFTCAENHIYSNNYSFDSEAILIAGNANVGQAKYYKGKFEAYQRTYVLTNFSEDINVKYLYTFLDSNLQRHLIEQVQSSAMSYIKLPMLERYVLPVPTCKEEQKKIADCFSSIDDLISAQTQKLDALKDHKKGLMQQLFPSIDEVDE